MVTCAISTSTASPSDSQITHLLQNYYPRCSQAFLLMEMWKTITMKWQTTTGSDWRLFYGVESLYHFLMKLRSLPSSFRICGLSLSQSATDTRRNTNMVRTKQLKQQQLSATYSHVTQRACLTTCWKSLDMRSWIRLLSSTWSTDRICSHGD